MGPVPSVLGDTRTRLSVLPAAAGQGAEWNRVVCCTFKGEMGLMLAAECQPGRRPSM